MMPTRRWLLTGMLLASLAFALAACGSDNNGTAPTPTTRPAAAATTAAPTAPAPAVTATTPAKPPSTTAPTGTTPTTTDTAAIQAAALRMVDAIRQHDRDQLHDMTGEHLREHLRDQDMDHLASCVPEGTGVRVVDQQVEINGDTATVRVTLELTAADGAKTTVERTLAFAKDADGVWRLSEMPECPLHDHS